MIPLTEEKLKQKIFNNSYPEPNTGCWLWGDSVNIFGYGIQKASKLNKKLVTAHRVSYWVNKHHFDLSLHVLHTCDQPSCVNPDHLFLGTHQDNMDDRKRKNRTNRIAPKGSKCGASILKENDVIQIREMAGNFKQHEIAKKFGVTQSAISYIILGKTWK